MSRHPDEGQDPLDATMTSLAARRGRTFAMRQASREWIPASAGMTTEMKPGDICNQ
jgi:hypothetical protein